jgi:hypothetical protein
LISWDVLFSIFITPTFSVNIGTPVTDDHGDPVWLISFRVLWHRPPFILLPPPLFVNGIIVVSGWLSNDAVNVNIMMAPPSARLLCNHHWGFL